MSNLLKIVRLMKRGEFFRGILHKRQILLLSSGFSHGHSTNLRHCSSVTISGTKEVNPNLKDQKIVQNFPDQPKDTLIQLSNKLGNYPKLFFIHGLEGNCMNLKYISSLLQLDSYGLQWSKTVTETSIRDIATQYIREVKKVQEKGPYNICGYSSGATTAFEMIYQLHHQHNDIVSNFIVLDGCLNWDFKYLDTTKILMTVMTKIVTDPQKLQDLAKTLSFLDLTQQLDTCSSFLKLEICNPEKDAIISFFERLKTFWLLLLDHEIAAYEYSGGATTVVKAAEKSLYFSLLKDQETYHIKDKCAGPFQVFTVDGNHYSFLSPKKAGETAAILNSINFNEN